MATVSAPYGLRPVTRAGGAYEGTIRSVSMTTNSSSAVAVGGMVNLAAGVPTMVTSTSPTTTRNSSTPFGVITGISYVNPNGRWETSELLPANAITNGYTSVRIHYVDDPDAYFMIQATAAVTVASIGLNAPITFNSVDTTRRVHPLQLTAGSIASTNTLALRIKDLPTYPGASTPGDAFTDCLVQFNVGVHADRNATGG